MQTAHNYLLRWPSYTALKSLLVVMQNFQLLQVAMATGLLGVK